MIIVNGKEEKYEKVSVLEYIQRKGYRLDRVAVEINEEIVAKSQYSEIYFNDEDRIEIIHFVGGG